MVEITRDIINAVGGALVPMARPANNLVALLGDSRFDYGLLRDGSDARIVPAITSLNMSIGAWLEAFTGQRIQCPPIYNFGVAGYKTDDIVNNTLAQAISCPAATVLLLAGTNDRGGANRTLQSSIDNMTTILNALQAAGKLIVLFSELPRDGITGDQPYIALQFAEWLRRVAFKRPGVVGVDAWPGMADPLGTVTTTRNISQYKDGAHLQGAGAYTVAKAAAPAFNAIFPPVDALVANNFDLYDATRTPGGNLLINGMLAGTGGAIGNASSGTITGASSDLATNWRLDLASAAGVTATIAKDTTGAYPAQRIALSGTPTSTSTTRAAFFTSADFSASLVEGDTLEAMALFEAAAAPGLYNGISLEVALTTGSGTTTAAWGARDISSNYMPTEAWSLPVRVPQVTVPAGVTNARLIARITFPQNQAQSGVFKFGRASVRKVAKIA